MTQKSLYVLFGIALSLTLGCGQKTSFKSIPLADTPLQNPAPAPEPDPDTPAPPPEEVVVHPGDGVNACEIDMAQVRLDGNVNSFEMSGGFNLLIGYNPNGGYGDVGGTANVGVKWAKMDLSLFATDPMSSGPITDTEVNSSQTQTNIGVTVNFEQISVNPNVYLETPLAKVSKTALEKGLANIKKVTDKMPWIGRVREVRALDKTLIINAGTSANVRQGDQFTVYEVKHYWSGAPCASDYLGSERVTNVEPVKITIASVGNMTSIARIDTGTGYDMKRGSEVEILQLIDNTKKNPRAPLKKKLILGGISAKPFAIPGGGSFDLAPVLNTQARSLVDDNGFVLAR